MKISVRLLSGLVALLAFAAVASPLLAQAPPQQRPSNIAVVDVSRIFKEHKQFRKALEDMKADVKAAENGLTQDRDGIANMQKQLRTMQAGSQPYKQLENQVATAMSQLQLKMNLQKKEFMEKEAKVYHQTYQQVQAEVAYFARRYGIDIVLRYNSTPIDVANRQSVLAGVNKAVVYHSGVDITDKILGRLNPPTPAPGTANRTGTFPR